MRMAVHLEVGLVWCSSAALCGNTLCGNTLCGNKPCGNKLCGNTPYHGRLRHAVTFALIRMVKIACIRIQEEYTSELLDIRRRAMELGAYPLATCRVWPVEGEVPWGVVCRFILCFHISSVLLMARHATMLTCHMLPCWHVNTTPCRNDTSKGCRTKGCDTKVCGTKNGFSSCRPVSFVSFQCRLRAPCPTLTWHMTHHTHETHDTDYTHTTHQHNFCFFSIHSLSLSLSLYTHIRTQFW